MLEVGTLWHAEAPSHSWRHAEAASKCPHRDRCRCSRSNSPLRPVQFLRLPRIWGVPLDMSRIHPECPDSDAPDRSVAADVLLRQEPDEEEDEEEDEGDDKEDDDDDDTDDGYSE